VRDDDPREAGALIAEAEGSFADSEAQRHGLLNTVRQKKQLAADSLDCMHHGFARNGDLQIVGEYADGSARIFLLNESGEAAFSPYRDDVRVRHVHAVGLHRDRLYVSTGDEAKYLDCFRIVASEIRFEKRICQQFGGFTALCPLSGRLYLGTDFSSRPNYILCLETGEKFGFPEAAYKMYCVIMIPLRSRFILCVNVSAPYTELQRVVSIFDTERKSFTYCAPYHGTGFAMNWELIDS
jgi:hypothetical protein